MPVALHQFLFSHYNDKARWVLAWKQVEHVRHSYLPGPHVPLIRRLSGQQQTPVLVWDGEVVAGSGAIVDYVDERVPERPLQPDDPAAPRWQPCGAISTRRWGRRCVPRCSPC